MFGMYVKHLKCSKTFEMHFVTEGNSSDCRRVLLGGIIRLFSVLDAGYIF